MITVKNATEIENGAAVFSGILIEATRRMARMQTPMWPEENLTVEKILEVFAPHEIYIGYVDDEPGFAFTLLESDDRYWGEGSGLEGALYIHKIAVTDAHTGKGMPEEIVKFAKAEAYRRGKTRLRLDTRANRPKLHELYGKLGFKKHHQASLFGWYEGIFFEMDI